MAKATPKAVKFRSLKKERIPGEAPVDVIDRLRLRAASERRSLSWIMTDVVCRGLGLDPAKYGIDNNSPKG